MLNKHADLKPKNGIPSDMQQLIEEVTRRLVAKLPESKAYYSLTDLHDFQIPEFMINRIELELRRNLADSVVPPETDWANMQSPNVKVSWDQFLKAIHEQVRLPRSYAKTVFEVCVADIIELLSQPRKHMTEVLFGDQQEMKFEELRQAANLITVYHYLPDALIKYMHRKQLPSISKEKAQQIMVLVDEKITAGYTPLNWAQLIDPLYTLLGEAIDTELLRLFFEDKGNQRWASFFDKEKADISRTRFIEVLSMPELDGIEPLKPSVYSRKSEPVVSNSSFKPIEQEVTHTQVEQETTKPSVVQPVVESESSVASIPKIEETAATLPKAEENTRKTEVENQTKPESVQEEKPVNRDNQPVREHPAQKVEKPLVQRINYVFNDETMEFEKVVEFVPEDEIEHEEQSTESVAEQHHVSFASPEIESSKKGSTSENAIEEKPIEQRKKVDSPLKSYDPYSEILTPETQTDGTAHPKPKNFDNIEDDDVPIYKKLEKSTSHETEQPLHEQIKQEEDIPFWKRFMPLDPPKPKPVVKQDIDPSELFDFLAENEDIYISDIFGGFQNTYVEAITELAGFVYWEEASKYIKEEIFRVNRISPLDDAALDFISRLQEWFTNK